MVDFYKQQKKIEDFHKNMFYIFEETHSSLRDLMEKCLAAKLSYQAQKIDNVRNVFNDIQTKFTYSNLAINKMINDEGRLEDFIRLLEILMIESAYLKEKTTNAFKLVKKKSGGDIITQLMNSLSEKLNAMNKTFLIYQKVLQQELGKEGPKLIEKLVLEFFDKKELRNILNLLNKEPIEKFRRKFFKDKDFFKKIYLEQKISQTHFSDPKPNSTTTNRTETPKKKHWFIARREDEIDKAAIDFYSIGHILMGQIFFFITYALLKWPLYEKLGEPNVELWAIIVAVSLGVIWEPFENLIVIKLGTKFKRRLDSWLNSIFDILFVTFGAFISHWINDWRINLTLVIVEFIVFFILRAYFGKKI